MTLNGTFVNFNSNITFTSHVTVYGVIYNYFSKALHTSRTLLFFSLFNPEVMLFEEVCNEENGIYKTFQIYFTEMVETTLCG